MLLALSLLGAAAATPYTMLVCDEANSCDDICTSRTDRLNPQWHLATCPNSNDPCNAASIECLSLRYITIDDVVAQYGERQPATVAEKQQQTGLFVSVQTELAGGANEEQAQVEWLHVMAQGVSNVQHWLTEPEGWMGLKSFESKTDDQLHVVFDDQELLVSSILSAADANGIYVRSLMKAFETSPMPDGGDQIGRLVVQMVDADLHAQIAAGAFEPCILLEKLKLGVADNYDHVFFVAANTEYYTSTHSNIHQEAIPGTGLGSINIEDCGGARVKGATVLQPLGQGQMGPFFHEWYHQYAAHMSALHPQLGLGGHWGWVGFPDHRGMLGGFNYLLCPDGSRFSMDASQDPATECGYGPGDTIYISADETEEVRTTTPLNPRRKIPIFNSSGRT
jgi:hypothetical protein